MTERVTATTTPITTLVHLGDLHAAHGPRNKDRYAALDQAINEHLNRPDLGAWLWPGDLSHAGLSIADRNALADRIQVMANAAPVVIAKGNHDPSGDLNVYGRLDAAHPIVVIEQPDCVRLTLATGQSTTIFGLPYPTKAGFVAQGIVPGDVGDVAGEALDAIFDRAASDLERARDVGDITLMIGHINVAGSLTSTGQPNIGHEIELLPRHLDALGPIYKGLNHIHKAQEIHGAYYPGSMCRLSWGEIEPKEYLTVSYAADHSFVVTHHPLHVLPMYHVTGTLTRDGFVFDDPALDLPSWVASEVRVRYSYRQSEKAVLDHDAVAKRFVGAVRLKIEPLAVPDRALRAPAVATATTLAAKLEAWAAVSGVEPSTLLQKLARLETTAPDALIADVQKELEAVLDGSAVAA